MEVQDRLQSFYNDLKRTGVIKNFPDDYNVFQSSLSDPATAKNFYEDLKGIGIIKNLPNSFEEFSSVLLGDKGTPVVSNPVDLENLRKSLTDFDEQNKGFFEGLESYQKDLEEASKRHDPFRVNEALNNVRKNSEKYNNLSKEREKLVKEIYTHPETLKERKKESEKIDGSIDDIDSLIKSIDNHRTLRFLAASNMMYLSDAEREQAREIRRLDEAKKIYKDTKEMLYAPGKYDESNGFLNFLKGGGDVFNNRDFWSAGMTQIARNLDIREILEKVHGNKDGENVEDFLTKGEQALLNAFLTQTEVQSKRAKDLSGGYMAGQSAAQSVDFMAEFLATGGLAAAASGGAKKAIMKWIVKHTPSSSLRREMAKGLAWTTESGLGTLARTPVMPSTYRSVTDELLLYKTDNEGNVLLDENKQPILKSGWESFRDGFTNSLIENVSELSGEHITGTFGVLGKTANRILPKDIQNLFQKTGNSIASWKPVELYNNFSKTPVYKFLKETGFNGFVPEMAEEWYGNGLRAMLGDTAALKDFATVENQLITAAAFLPMSLIGGSVSAVQMVRTKGRYENSLKTLQYVLSDLGYKQEQVDYFIDQVNASSAREMAKTITPIINRIALENEEKGKEIFKAVSDFVYAKSSYHIQNGAYAEQMGERKKAEDERLLKETGGYVNSVTGKVEIVTDKEGNKAFLVGESVDTDHKVYILNYNGRKITLSREDFEEEYNLENEFDKDEFLNILIMNEDFESESAGQENAGETEQTNMNSIRPESSKDAIQDQVPGTGLNQMSYRGQPVRIVEDNVKEDGTMLIENEEGEVVRVPATDLERMTDIDVPETTYQESSQSEGNIQAEPIKEIPFTKAGKPDYNAMLEMDPEMFASEWEKRSTPEKAKATLERQSENIGKKIESLQGKVGKETDLNKIADIEDEIAILEQQKEKVDGVILTRYTGPTGNLNGVEKVNNTAVVSEFSTEQESNWEAGDDVSEESDENGIPFVKNAAGSTVLGEVRAETGLPEAPIKLSQGFQGENGKGYGLRHIEAQHGKQIHNAGFNTVESFVESVASGFTTIRKGNERFGNETYLLELTDNKNNTLFVELSNDGSYWNVNSAGIFRKGYSKGKEIVWTLPALSHDSTTRNKEVARSITGDKGSSGSTSGNSSQTISSENKGKNIPREKQIESQNDLQDDTALLQNVGLSSKSEGNESIRESQEDKIGNTENTPVNVLRARIRHFDGKEYFGDIVKEEKGRVTIKDDISGREISVPKKRVIERFGQSSTNNYIAQKENNDGTKGTEISKSVSQGAGRKEDEVNRILDEASAIVRRSKETTRNVESTEGYKGRQIEVLKEYAQKNGFWIADRKVLGEFLSEGGENEVYYISGSGYVNKLNNFEYAGDDLSNFFDRLIAHNKLFPEVPYKLIGFSENRKGEFSAVLEQSFIPVEREATEDEISSYMKKLGFEDDGDGNFHNDKYDVFDAVPNNVLMGTDGNLYFIDTQITGNKSAKNKDNIGKSEDLYITQDGRKLTFSFEEISNESSQQENAPVNDSSNISSLLDRHLRKLKKGEFAYVERVFTENKLFSFTGAEKIESVEDVVYIFKELEDASVENVFVVFVKDGIPTVQHLGIGDYCRAMVNTPAVWEAYKRLDPDIVYFVHNHPTGSLEASRQDQNTFENLRNIFGDKLQPGIIINLNSGKYGKFSENDLWTEEKSNKQIDEVPIKIYSFNKQVFEANFNPLDLFQIKTSNDVASFVSSHRLGYRKKISFLVLNSQNKVVGNFFTGYTGLTNKNLKNLSDYIVRHINKYGGQNAILYGDFSSDSIMNQKLGMLIRRKSGNDFSLLDVIKCSGNNSAVSVMETPSVYENTQKGSIEEVGKGKSDDIRFRHNNVPEDINGRFNKELQQQIEGVLAKGHVYQLGNPNSILRSAGIPDLPIELSANRLAQKSSTEYESNHPFNLKSIQDLPEALANPIAVFDSRKKNGGKVILTELTEGGDNFVAAIQVRRSDSSRRIEVDVNSIRSLYPKDRKNGIIEWVNEGLLKWVDKEKASNFISTQWPNYIAGGNSTESLNSITNIVENFENPTLQEGKISSEIDRMSDELGVKVNKVKDRGELPEGIQKRMKDGRYPGLFDPATGRIWILIDEVIDVADVQATMLHEIIGHKGIHGLFGDRLPEFCKKVLSFLEADERAEWLKRYGGDEQLAAEEYIARFAEGYKNPTMWEKVKAIVKDFFRTLGIDLKLSNNDLKYILWKAKNRLKEGDRMLESIEKIARGREIERKLWGRDRDIEEDLIEEVNKRFNELLETLTEKDIGKIIFNLGIPSDMLRAGGVENKPIKLYGSKVIKKMKKHGFELKELKNLPKAVAYPIAVFNNLERKGNRSILTELKTENNNFLVTIDVGKGEDVDFDIVSSVFGKRGESVIHWINKGYLTNVNKEKALNYLHLSAPIAEASNNQELSFATNIVENFKNPKFEDRILFRKAPDEDFAKKHMSFTERAREELQDRMLSVKLLLDEVKRRGGKVTDYANPYVAENLATSKSKAQIEAFDKNVWDPLLNTVKVFSERGKSIDDIDRYMMAKHAPERNARLEERENVKDGSGISNEEAKQIVDEFEKDFTKDEVDDFWNKVRAVTRFTTETQWKHGLVDKETKDYYDNMYEYYVPLRGWKESEAKEIEYLSDSRTRGTINLNKKAKGRSSIADSPLAYIANMAHSAIVVGNKNDIKRNVFEMMVLNKNPDLYQLKKVYRVNTGSKEYPIWVEQIEKPAVELWVTGRVEVVTDHRNDAGRTYFQTKEHQVEVFVNGQKYVMEFNGNMGVQTANAINGLNLRRADALQNSMGRVTRWMSANYTSRNPAFVVTNFMRDFGYAVPAYWMKEGHAAILMKNMPKAFAAIHNDLSGKNVDSEVQQLYNEFKENGGLTGYVYMTDIESYKKQIKREIRRSVGEKTLGDLVFRNVAMCWGASALEYLAQMSENSTRFAVYMSERQAGKSATQAAYAAKEITTNFNRKGRSSGVIGSLFAFFNATIQGSANAIDLARRSPSKFSVYCAGIIMMQYFASALCRMFGGEDEIGEKNYDRLSDWVKYNNLVLPDVFGVGDGKFITIPLPHFFRALSSLGVIAGEVSNGVKTAGKGIEALFDAVSGDLTPVEIATPQFKNLNSLFQSIMPTVIKPYMEAYHFNRNFMGLPISRKSYFGSQEGIVPQYKLATNKTNPLLVDLAKWLNKVSGGGDYTTSEISFDPETGDVGRNGWKSWSDLNPAKFEHLVEGIFGGRLTFFNNIWKTVKSILSEEDIEAMNIPVLRRLYQSPYGSSAWEKFYEVRDRVADIDAKANEFMKLGDYDNFIKVNSYKNASLVNVYKSYEKMIRRLNKAISLTKEGSVNDMLKKQREDLVKDFALKMKEMERKNLKNKVLVH